MKAEVKGRDIAQYTGQSWRVWTDQRREADIGSFWLVEDGGGGVARGRVVGRWLVKVKKKKRRKRNSSQSGWEVEQRAAPSPHIVHHRNMWLRRDIDPSLPWLPSDLHSWNIQMWTSVKKLNPDPEVWDESWTQQIPNLPETFRSSC